jgi:NAD(P)-dependent dehydrogenase (short-subunit alcohol dehydrogenase family)
MDLELSGKVAVVTGASKGIGLAVTRTLAAEGAKVFAGARTVDALAGIERVTAVAVDLIEPSGPERLVGGVVQRHGHLDVLVNNVGGVKLRVNGFLSTSDEEFEASMQLNFFAALRATRAALAVMLPRRAGAIERGLRQRLLPAGRPRDRLRRRQGSAPERVEALSQELGPQGIRINSVSRPGRDRSLARR